MRKKINICYFLGSFQIGGAENHVLQILTHIDSTRYRPYVCVFKAVGGLKKEFFKLNIPIVSFSFWRRNFVTKYFQLGKYIQFLKKNKIDVVHVHHVGCFRFGVKGAIFAKVNSIIITWHGLYDLDRVKKTGHVRYGNKNASKIVAVSEKVKNSNCKTYKIDTHKVDVVYNGILSNKFNNKYNINKKSKKFVIGCVGNLRHEKGYKYLLYALSKIKNKIPEIKLIIIGNGPLLKDLQKLTMELKISNITEFLDRRNDVEQLLKTFDVWIMSSIYEGFSVALLEAMATSLPIIATDVGGNAEAIEHKKSGLIIPPKDSEMLAKAIYFMYKHPEKRIQFAINAKEKCAKYFSMDVMLDDLYKIYE